MAIANLALLSVLALCFQFFPLLSSKQAVKSTEQVEKHVTEAFSYFSSRQVPDLMLTVYDNELFLILDEERLVSFLMVKKQDYYSQKERKKYISMGFYYCCVTEKYRGRGISAKIMAKSVDALTREYGLPADTLLVLHVSPKDQLMPVAAKVYYELGFRKGVFVENGPDDFMYKADELFANARDMLDVADNESCGHGSGYYFLLYCRLSEFNKGKGKNYSSKECATKTKKLFSILKSRFKARSKASRVIA